jgi:hypothetical protein
MNSASSATALASITVPVIAGRVKQRFAHHGAADPHAERVYLHGGALVDARREIGVGDRALDGVAVAAARHPPDGLAADAHGLVAEYDRPRILERDRSQPPLGLAEGARADEVLVLANTESEPGFERGVIGRDVSSPHAVALLESQRVDRTIAAGDQAMRLPGLPEGAPQRRAVLGRAVELPTELADERDADGADRNVADRDLA